MTRRQVRYELLGRTVGGDPWLAVSGQRAGRGRKMAFEHCVLKISVAKIAERVHLSSEGVNHAIDEFLDSFEAQASPLRISAKGWMIHNPRRQGSTWAPDSRSVQGMDAGKR